VGGGGCARERSGGRAAEASWATTGEGATARRAARTAGGRWTAPRRPTLWSHSPFRSGWGADSSRRCWRVSSSQAGQPQVPTAIPQARADDVSIPNVTSKLSNGLTVILHEDHSLPIVAVNIAYRVGSRFEEPKRTGFAHLFEHLMFMGTRRAPTKAFDAWMEAAGATTTPTRARTTPSSTTSVRRRAPSPPVARGGPPPRSGPAR
jgi:zinc protease